MPNLRILFEAGPMMDIQRTGVGHFVSRLMTSLDEHYGAELDLTGYYFDFLGHNHKQPPTLPHTSFQTIRLVPGKLLSLCRRLNFQPPLECFTRHPAEIVMFTNYVSLPTLRRRKSVLFIYDLVVLDHPEYMQPINRDYLRRFSIPSIQRADVIVTISEFTKQRLLHHFPDLKAKIIITPIPPIANTATKRISIPGRLDGMGVKSERFILFVSTLEPRKNIQNLLAGYAYLPAHIREEYSLVLAGGKGWHDEGILADIDRLQKDGHDIIRTGYISEEEKQALYSNASCFVMPSHYEGFGMPIFEAMQFGLPVACSDIPVFHEVAQDAVVYFDRKDPQAIADTLSEILTNKELRTELTSKAKGRLAAYDWKTNATTVYDAIKSL